MSEAPTHYCADVLFIDERMSWVKWDKIFREFGKSLPDRISIYVAEKPPSYGAEGRKVKFFKRIGGDGSDPTVYLHSRWDDHREEKRDE